MIKKVYSKKLKKNVWAFRMTIDGLPFRRSGFESRDEAEVAEAALRLQSRAIRHSKDVAVIAENRLAERGVRRLIAEYVAPLERRVDRLMEENLRLREEVRQLKEEAEGSTLLDLSAAAELTGIPLSRLSDAIKDGLLPATPSGSAC
jgi:hypothetical protein